MTERTRSRRLTLAEARGMHRVLADVSFPSGRYVRITEWPSGYFVDTWFDGEHVENQGPFDTPEKAWGNAYL